VNGIEKLENNLKQTQERAAAAEKRLNTANTKKGIYTRANDKLNSILSNYQK